MLLHAMMTASRVNGPGLRAVIWFQGCSLGCDGCTNATSHPFVGKEISISDVAGEVLRACAMEPLEGVTFSGGEPMQQAADLAELIEELRAAEGQLSFGLFTGYTERELDTGRYFCISGHTEGERQCLWRQIRERLDFAVMGRYNRLQPSAEGLCSSRNQRLRLFSHRYTMADFGSLQTEVVISDDGLTQITGFPILGEPF
jgi:anaerobic ribonucleoside-triphosphate reductase activating protein